MLDMPAMHDSSYRIRKDVEIKYPGKMSCYSHLMTDSRVYR